MVFPLILLGKTISILSRMINIGSGGTWPGEVALRINPQIFTYFVSKVKKGIILVAGTNGKTTTALIVQNIISQSNKKGQIIVHNDSGANLLNGLISAFINKTPLFGPIIYDWAILEVDENTLPAVISKIKYQKSKIQIKNQKLIIVLLNLFRDQLDRYGEVDLIAAKWQKSLASLPKSSVVILNADDPQIAYLGKNLKNKVIYFGINKKDKFLKNIEHATDSIFCHECGEKLSYEGVYFSHLGVWCCQKCGNKRPTPQITNWQSKLSGLYNEYNTLAAVGVAIELGFDDKTIRSTLNNFTPAFGRQEEFDIDGKKVKIFLSKNPAGFNASLRTVLELKSKVILFVLNDRIPDGRDVSWIWDVDFENIADFRGYLAVSGERCFDLALRLKYAGVKLSNMQISPDLKQAVYRSLKDLKEGEILYILPTYSAMLDTRKILKGRKIL